MKSIRGKFAILSLVGILVCTAIIGGLGLWSTARAQDEASNEVLALSCLKEANRLNEELIHIEGSVESCADYVRSNLSSPSLLADRMWRQGFLEEMQRLESSIASNTRGVCAYYIHFAPELSSADAGYFYAQEGREERMVRQPLTDITAYDVDDEEANWYYVPMEVGAPMWLEPYYNETVGINMVSYVVPIYVGRTFIGVVGMDVNFSLITGIVRQIKPYETGNASLVGLDGTVWFDETLERGSLIADAVSDLAPVVARFPELDEGVENDIVTYTADGVSRKLSYTALRNYMCLLLSVDTAEINAPVTQLLQNVALVGIALAVIVVLVVVKVAGKITEPLGRLVEVADEVAAGNLDVEMPEAGDDEVGALAHSLEMTVASLRTYISGISAKAYRDALTGVRNKAAYEEAADRLSEEMKQDVRSFGLLMIDVNNLKLVNDRYGHRHGDDYLRACSKLICDLFEHSPVYRIGGDEFLVILEGHDYERRDELVSALDAEIVARASAPEVWERLSMAKGLAVCEDGDERLDDVFHRADEAMYENKRQMKCGRR